MKKNKYLHRFVALVMTAVMLLSLVVIDNRIGMKAEDEYTKEVINLETYIPKKVTYKKNKDGSVKTGSVEEVEISVPEETAVTFKGDYLMQELDASDKKQIIATSCDASDKKTTKQASEIEEIRITDSEDEYQYAVYKAASNTESLPAFPFDRIGKIPFSFFNNTIPSQAALYAACFYISIIYCADIS